MNLKKLLLRGMSIFVIALFTSLGNFTSAQVDTAQVIKPDTVVQKQEQEKKEKKDKKRKDEFIPYVGINFNQLNISENDKESSTGIGYHLGFSYKRGKFFYWQIGTRFNHAVYNLKFIGPGSDTSDYFGVNAIDVPLTGGINFLSPLNRIVALRLFVSAVPSFTLGVGDNDLGISKDDLNSFILYGQAGIGVNVAFLVIEAGYNFGFQDMFEEVESKPGQVFVNLGFRF